MERRSPILIHCLKKGAKLTTLSFLFEESNEYVSAAVRPLGENPSCELESVLCSQVEKQKKFVGDAESRV